MQLSELEHKRILILGYAREGRASETFLRAQVPSATILIADQKDGPDYLTKQNETDLVIKTPGIPRRLVRKPYTTGTNIFYAYLKERGMKNMIIGVTGSKGKSTTASLIAAMLRADGKTAHLIGNIGSPALDVLQKPIGTDDSLVMELSSYQCEDLDWSPDISVFTSIFPEHLDYHGGFDNYFAAKKKIVAHATKDGLLVYNPAYPALQSLRGQTLARAVPYIDAIPFDISGAQLKGAHNEENIRAAITVGTLCRIPEKIMQKAILAFEPLPHRLTTIGTYKGITFVDDAIATAPEPTLFALKTLGNVDTILLGGSDRGFDFLPLAEMLKEANVRNVVLFPETGEKIEQAIKKVFEGSELPTMLKTSSMEEAVRFAYKRTALGKTCLLSTASPSYSLWKDFEAKGNEFTQWVRKLEGAPKYY